MFPKELQFIDLAIAYLRNSFLRDALNFLRKYTTTEKKTFLQLHCLFQMKEEETRENPTENRRR